MTPLSPLSLGADAAAAAAFFGPSGAPAGASTSLSGSCPSAAARARIRGSDTASSCGGGSHT